MIYLLLWPAASLIFLLGFLTGALLVRAPHERARVSLGGRATRNVA